MTDKENSTIDEIVAYMAVNHNVMIPRNDPVILAILFNEQINQKLLHRINESYNSFEETLLRIYKNQESIAIDSVHNIMDECKSLAIEALEQTAKSAAATLKNELHESINKFQNQSLKNDEAFKLHRNIALSSAVISLLCMIATVIVIMK